MCTLLLFVIDDTLSPLLPLTLMYSERRMRLVSSACISPLGAYVYESCVCIGDTRLSVAASPARITLPFPPPPPLHLCCSLLLVYQCIIGPFDTALLGVTRVPHHCLVIYQSLYKHGAHS